MENPDTGRWEQRWHPLRREWVVYSAHRNDRPWGGQRERTVTQAPVYDPSCYLCPGNKRIHGSVNPDYKDVFIFDNDHPIVGPDAPDVPAGPFQDLYRKSPAKGIARVICYDPRHNVTLTDVPPGKAVKVFAAWRDQTREMARTQGIRFALFFENKGMIVGTSNLHPHCQLYATNFPFKHIEMELESAAEFKKAENRSLFDSILAAEKSDGRRLVALVGPTGVGKTTRNYATFVRFSNKSLVASTCCTAWCFPT